MSIGQYISIFMGTRVDVEPDSSGVEISKNLYINSSLFELSRNMKKEINVPLPIYQRKMLQKWLLPTRFPESRCFSDRLEKQHLPLVSAKRNHTFLVLIRPCQIQLETAVQNVKVRSKCLISCPVIGSREYIKRHQ